MKIVVEMTGDFWGEGEDGRDCWIYDSQVGKVLPGLLLKRDVEISWELSK